MAKRLYIETVGCQMNVLDSELVVGGLRKQRLRARPTTRPTPTSSSSTPAPSANTPRTRSTPPSAACVRSRSEHPEKVIGVLGCMAQKDQELDLQAGARTSTWSSAPGSSREIPELIDEVAAGSGPQMAVSLGRTDGPRHEVERSFESYDPLRDPTMRPTPFQAFVRIQIGCDKFCTYCVVPRTRGPEQSRAAGAHPRRGPQARRPGLQGSHAARPDGQQLQLHAAAAGPRG